MGMRRTCWKADNAGRFGCSVLMVLVSPSVGGLCGEPPCLPPLRVLSCSQIPGSDNDNTDNSHLFIVYGFNK